MITIFQNFSKQKGSSLILPAHGWSGARARKNKTAAANREDGSAGGFKGGMPSRPSIKIVASPAALLVESRTPKKSFVFHLEEKIRRAQIKNRRQNFSLGWRVVASGGGAASLVPFKVGSREVYNYSTKTNLFGIDCSARRVRRAPQGKIRFCFRRKIPEFAPITI